RLGGAVRGRLTQNVVGRGLHQARGQIDHVADQRVFASPAVANGTAEHASRGDADSRLPAERLQASADGQGHLCSARRVIFMRQRWQAERSDKRDALVVYVQLVNAPFIM